MGTILQLQGIHKSFGDVHVVKGTEVDIEQGEIFSLLGPSGCGKTTLLRIIAGFERPDKGRVLLDGQDITALPPNRRPVNTVFQNYALFPHLTVAQNIAFGLKAEGVGKAECARRVEEMLELTQMREHADKRPAQISGGQKQRVAIARALVKRPRVLLLDEPLAALDLKLRQRMLLELDRIHDEVGITFVFVTHDQDEAMSLSDRMAVMNLGIIEQIGTPAQVYEMPRSPFVAAFIGDTNFLPGTIKSLTGDGYCSLVIEDFAACEAYMDAPFAEGAQVALSIRPEKLNIARERVEPGPRRNIVRGIVEDIIYMGSETKYWVRCGKHRLHVLRQHNRCLLEEQPITWEDEVWLTWHADDVDVLEATPPPNLDPEATSGLV